jgi:hypothetical protein
MGYGHYDLCLFLHSFSGSSETALCARLFGPPNPISGYDRARRFHFNLRTAFCFAEHAQGIELENIREKSFVTFISFLFSK